MGLPNGSQPESVTGSHCGASASSVTANCHCSGQVASDRQCCISVCSPVSCVAGRHLVVSSDSSSNGWMCTPHPVTKTTTPTSLCDSLCRLIRTSVTLVSSSPFSPSSLPFVSSSTSFSSCSSTHSPVNQCLAQTKMPRINSLCFILFVLSILFSSHSSDARQGLYNTSVS